MYWFSWNDCNVCSELKSYGLETEIDQFEANTPIFGNLTFKNIIGKYNPNADEFLAVACHYDSKYFPDIPNFVGAIDSAVPAAILLNLAKVLLPVLENVERKSNIGIMVYKYAISIYLLNDGLVLFNIFL